MNYNNDRSSWSYKDWMNNDSKGLELMQQNEPGRFNLLLNNYKNTYNLGLPNGISLEFALANWSWDEWGTKAPKALNMLIDLAPDFVRELQNKWLQSKKSNK